jgi:hypothetical protein
VKGRRHAVAQRDCAGLVEQQHVHVARGFDGAPAGGEHVALHHAIHAADADGAEQPADGGRNQTDEQRDQHRQGCRGRGGLTSRVFAVHGEAAQTDDRQQKDDGQP